jgi:cytochrome c-type biogenesis protein
MIWLLGYSFLSGIGTLLAPCIWPVVPVILSPSVVGKDHRKSFGIVTGIIFSFWLFTFFVALGFKIFHVDTSISKNISALVTAFFGILLLMPGVLKRVNEMIRRFTKAADKLIEFKEHSFSDGLVTGLFLGLIWSPSAGPIVAMISGIVKAEQLFTEVMLITTAYVLGLGIPLFIIAYVGQRFFRQKKVSPHAMTIQQIIGIALLLSAFMLITNLDIFFSKQIIKVFPQAEPLLGVFGNKPTLPE